MQIFVRRLALTTVLILLTAIVTRAGDDVFQLSSPEEHLVEQIGFEKDIAGIVKQETASILHRMIGYDEKGYQVLANGLTVSVPQGRADQVLGDLRSKLQPRRYQAFFVEKNDAVKVTRIGIVKGDDPCELLRIMNTNGDEDDISHDDVIEKLHEWEKRYSFSIIGAENNWVEIEFKSPPEDLKAFADEVYDFSPDTVDDVSGTLANLMKDIKSTKRLTLLWE